jgi:hypothetical protein
VAAAVAEVLQQCLPAPVRLAGDPVGDPVGQHPGQRLLQRRPVGVVAEHGDDAGRVHAVRVADQSRGLGDAGQRAVVVLGAADRVVGALVQRDRRGGGAHGALGVAVAGDQQQPVEQPGQGGVGIPAGPDHRGGVGQHQRATGLGVAVQELAQHLVTAAD